MRAHRQTLSQALSAIAADPVREAIADNDQITLLGGRGRAGLILRFALPNVLPAPPDMPHWSWLVNHRAEGVIGAFCLVLAAVLVLPIPFGNMLPAFAISLIALGVLELDGLWVMIGTMTGLVSLFIVAGVVSALVGSTILLLSHAFG
ncbi:exopolysaccharide biosynthesis protein [Pseudotabrizicola formosa]|uniref:exopolysaccharide biosynthesis protein n=1 Tax=Pseudotabrizicola formosa TaxID=2030009 RepID=UPI00143CF58E|nr:exopolysaccharide biosynthesis protein [Pseudotabrizicola formosa]